jgi:lysophospholipase L1-like esterase
MKVYKKAFFFLIVSIFYCFILFLLSEILVRLFYGICSNYDTEMWRYSVYGKTYINRDIFFHKNKSYVYFKDLYGVEVKINSKGLRDYEYSYEKPVGTYRILVLGDSIAFGWGVNFSNIYSKLLEKKLNINNPKEKYEIINSGVINYQLNEELFYLKNEGFKYSPDLIILGYFVDDAKINKRLSYNWLEKNSYLLAFLKSKLMAINSRFNKELRFDNFYKNFYKDGSLEKAKFEKNINELKSFLKDKNIPLVVVLIPELHDLKNYPFIDIHNYVKDRFSDVEVIDLLPYFDKQRNSQDYWVSFEDAHPNALAHEIMANAVFVELNKLILEEQLHR